MQTSFDESVERLVRLARDEDFGSGDITTALIENPDQTATFALLAKEPCVLAGRAVAPIVLTAYDPAIELSWSPNATDGASVAPDSAFHVAQSDTPSRAPATLAMLTGPLSSILAAERVLLNFLQRLCGVATLTRHYVEAIRGTGAFICDTRKTTPGWRLLEKYAVRCGGGTNHRIGLFDGVLIKDNHLSGVPTARLAGAVFEMLNRLPQRTERAGGAPPFVEIEADTIEQVEALLSVVGINAILLDNFTLDVMRRAVALRDDMGLRGRVLLEASGGVTLSTVRAVAETGVDRISVGALTHSARAIDLSMERIG